ncbi:RNase adapter RapZ [Lentzea sp. BCCO 10_0798]|uniref:RNase adapter RapZ n=1 Tax=Lentzea kristufekii TaxID=3095430 RepID=A0ABU4U6M3_9PSEU|nr:RNase adapter RapZ [Lentzea sp. BCCO 10_0798]MDX8055752.1 RNase adapter RapZ [Lentzea sp. BCCO 10_0798]
MKNTVSYQLLSFSYLHNQVPDADLIINVRKTLHDPSALNAELAGLDGRDPRIQEIVMSHPTAEVVADMVVRYVDTMSFQDQSCTVAIGCSHGRHRSVALIERIATVLNTYNYPVVQRHLRLELLENQPGRGGEQ